MAHETNQITGVRTFAGIVEVKEAEVCLPHSAPDTLDRMAQYLRARASDLRQRADAHERRGHAARWVSASAARFRQLTSDDRRRVDRAAAEMDRAATALIGHAQRLRDRLGLLASGGRELIAWLDHTGLLPQPPTSVVRGDHTIGRMVAPPAGSDGRRSAAGARSSGSTTANGP